MRRSDWVLALMLAGPAAFAAESSPAPACAALSALQHSGWHVESSEWQPAGFVPPKNFLGESAPTTRSMCRVVALGTPSSSSAIGFEVWLPEPDQWNGKLLGLGTGSFLGAIAYELLEDGIRRNYATVSTDYGHVSDSFLGTGWARGNPERVVDFGYRAQHLVTESAKLVIERYYGRAASHAYFRGCSMGGRMAMVEATRFPSDYDGIVAGAPPYSYPRYMAGLIWSGQAALRLSPHGIPASVAQILHRGALRRCGDNSGRIQNPMLCDFDPAELRCGERPSNDCLSEAEIETARAFYTGPRDRQGNPIIAGIAVGSELNWRRFVDVAPGEVPGISWVGVLQNFVYQRDDVDPRSIDFERAFTDAQAAMGLQFDAPPELSAFERRGGKLILYHGWADGLIPAQSSVDYVRAVVARLGSDRVEGFLRLFMVPGLAHCSNPDHSQEFGQWGELPFMGNREHDILAALEAWVESGVAPDHITTSTAADGRITETQIVPKFDINTPSVHARRQ